MAALSKIFGCVSFCDSMKRSRAAFFNEAFVLDAACCIIKLKNRFFFLGQLSVISAGFHITADSCKNTEIIENELYE